MTSHRRPPKVRSLLIVVGALQANIPSSAPECTLRKSENGVPNVRYAATTKDIPWIVDIYMGHYYRVQVGNNIGEVFRSIPPLLGFLIHQLGLATELGDRT
jgi:hypothetical protein